jgi:hypothetical protein
MSEPSLTSEDLSVYVDKHPFKSEAYLQKMGANGAPVPTRRNKPLKQILNQEREAYYQKRGMVDPTKKRGDSTPKRRKTEQDADGEVPAPREEVPLRDVPTCTFDHHSPQTQVYRLLRVSCPPSGTVILRV